MKYVGTSGMFIADLMAFYGDIYNFYNLRNEFKLVAAVLTDIIYVCCIRLNTFGGR